MKEVLVGFVGAVIVGLGVIGTVALIGQLRLWWMRRRGRKAAERAWTVSQFRVRR